MHKISSVWEGWEWLEKIQDPFIIITVLSSKTHSELAKSFWHFYKEILVSWNDIIRETCIIYNIQLLKIKLAKIICFVTD